MTLRAYVVHDGEPWHAAILVYAHSPNEARRLGWREVEQWGGDAGYLGTRARIARDPGGKEPVVCGEPRIVTDPEALRFLGWRHEEAPVCDCCGLCEFVELPESEVCGECRFCVGCGCDEGCEGDEGATGNG